MKFLRMICSISHFRLFAVAFLFTVRTVSAQVDSLMHVIGSTDKHVVKAEAYNELSKISVDTNSSLAADYALQGLEHARVAQNHEWTTSNYHQLGRAYIKNGQGEKAIKVYEQAIDYELSFEPQDKVKLAWMYHNFGSCYKNLGNYKSAKSYFKSSLTLEEELKNKDNQASCLLNLGAMHQYLGDNDSALLTLNKAYDIAASIEDLSTLNRIISNQALVYEAKGQYDKAIDMHREALLYETPESAGEAMSFANIGNSHYYMGQIDSTIHYYAKAIKVFEQTGNENELAMLSLNMGVFLVSQENYHEAIKSYKRAAEVFESLGNANFLSTAYLNLGSAYEKSNQYAKSKSNFEKALHMSREVGNKLNMATALQNIGIMQEKEGDFNSALKNHQECLELSIDMDDKKLIAESYIAIGGLYGKQKAYRRAEESILKGLELAEQIGTMKTMEAAYGNLVEAILLGSGNQRAYDYHRRHLEANDSLKSARNHQAVEQLMTEYNVREKEDSIKLQQAEIARQDLINLKNSELAEQRNAQLSISLIGLIVAISLGLLAFYNYRKKQKINHQLIAQNEVIERKNKEKELLLGEIHHRVKNNLQMVSSLLNLQQKDVSDLEAKKAITEGSGRVKSMALVHNMLYRDDHFSGIEIDAYTKRLINEVIMNLHPDGRIHLKTQLDPLKLDVDTAVPIGLILNELLTNTLKYAFENVKNPSITVDIKMKDNDLIVNYSDNGSIKEDILNKIDKAESFGLRMINSLTEQLKGQKVMTVNNGLHYTFTFNNIKTH